VDRVAAARERVQAIKAELSSPAADLPCIQCRYFEVVCTHPAASELRVSPISGKPKIKHFAAEKARAEDGACGPEGALFDSRSLPGLVVVSVLTSKWAMGGLLFVGAIVADVLLR
jgi:hypothetical protein